MTPSSSEGSDAEGANIRMRDETQVEQVGGNVVGGAGAVDTTEAGVPFVELGTVPGIGVPKGKA